MVTTAGKRNCRIAIQAYSGTVSATGAARHSWASTGIQRWARQRFLSGGQVDTGTRNTYNASHSFAVPAPTPVSIRDRIVRLSDNAAFDVVAVDQTNPAELVILAIEGQRNGS
jgi:head-tail adaptor